MAGVAVFVFLGTFMRDHAVCKPLVEFALGATNLAWHTLTYIFDELKLAAKLAVVGGEPLNTVIRICTLLVAVRMHQEPRTGGLRERRVRYQEE